MDQPVIIYDYDKAWPAMYDAEVRAILSVIGDRVVAHEHVGSTAVPGMAAKPIIDIMIGVRNIEEDGPACIKALESLGYQYLPEYEVSIPERRFFRKRGPGGDITHHLHVVETTTEFWDLHIVFRDYLRAHPEARQEYAEEKRRLARQFMFNRPAYQDGKTEVIRRIEARALAERAAREQTARPKPRRTRLRTS